MYLQKSLLTFSIIIVLLFLVALAMPYKVEIFYMLTFLSLAFLFLIFSKNQDLVNFLSELLKKDSISKRTDTDQKSSLIDDDIFEGLQTSKIEAIKSIINNHDAKKFFSLGLIGSWGSGKSTLLAKLTQEMKKEEKYIVINVNVWELESLENLLQEVDKEFDNIIFKYDKSIWIKHIVKSFFSKDYFSILSKYFIKSNISFSTSLAPTIVDAKKNYSVTLSQAIQDRKIVLIFDEVDRLDSKDEILNVFKAIRYLTSFDSVFTITALDMQKVISQTKIDSEYIHKIFNLKYMMPEISKNEIVSFLKEDIATKLSIFIQKEDFVRFISFRDQDTVKSLVDIVENYRQVKNCYNDTYILCEILQKQNTQWNEYISFEFIFVLNLIKSIDFSFYSELMKDTSKVGLLLKELNKLNDQIARLMEKDTDFKKIFDKLQKEHPKEMLVLISILKHFVNPQAIEQNIYIYTHYKLYDYLITQEMYSSFVLDTNNIEKRLNEIEIPENKTIFLKILISMIYEDKANQKAILGTILELVGKHNVINFQEIFEYIISNNGTTLLQLEYQDIFVKFVTNYKEMAFVFIDRVFEHFLRFYGADIIEKEYFKILFKGYFKDLKIDEKYINEIIKQFLVRIKGIQDFTLANELRKIMYDYFKNHEIKNGFNVYLLESIYYEEIPEVLSCFGESIDDFVDDENTYRVWIGSSYSHTQYTYKGKELKRKFYEDKEKENGK